MAMNSGKLHTGVARPAHAPATDDTPIRPAKTRRVGACGTETYRLSLTYWFMLACLVPLSLAHRSGPDTGRISQPPQPPHHQQAEAPGSDGPILSSLSAPRFDAPSVVYNWSAATFLHQPAKKGDVLVLLTDCVGVAAGRRLRVGTGTASEEEGVVATLQCPAPGLGPQNPRDALGAAMGASASRAGTALLPAGASVERRGEQFVPASIELSTGRVEVPHTSAVGVAQLTFALLHDHASGAPVMQYPAARPLPPLCPGGHPLGIGGHNLMTLCSGHGECDERTGTCACAAGRNGTACELLLCEADCSGRGVCRNGTCDCAAGWAAPACASRRLLYLPCISPTSPPHLPCISPTPPPHLPYISPTSPLHLPYISCASRRCVADCSGHGTCGADGA